MKNVLTELHRIFHHEDKRLFDKDFFFAHRSSFQKWESFSVQKAGLRGVF